MGDSESSFVVRRAAKGSLQILRDDRVVALMDFEGLATRVIAPVLEPEEYQLQQLPGIVVRPLGKLFKESPGLELTAALDPRPVAAYWVHDREVESPKSEARFKFRLYGDSLQPSGAALLGGPRLLSLREVWKDSEVEAGLKYYLDVEEEVSEEIQIYAAMGLVACAWMSRPDAERMGL